MTELTHEQISNLILDQIITEFLSAQEEANPSAAASFANLNSFNNRIRGLMQKSIDLT